VAIRDRSIFGKNMDNSMVMYGSLVTYRIHCRCSHFIYLPPAMWFQILPAAAI